jgi:uncharacterized membrane protein YphA (DoxX/SURF4 family)
MGVIHLIGRILLAVIFLHAGIAKFQKPEQAIGILNERYPALYDAFLRLTDLTLPELFVK